MGETRWQEWEGEPCSFWLDGIADGEQILVRSGDRICFERGQHGGEFAIDVERRGALQ